ncbi:MAG TPA: hypothetical protein VGO92_13450 [Acidimicrobiales bacterium]|jgi:hypothetical protein|nr:hypothetical protein [Acidimicrobiales bacterium]
MRYANRWARRAAAGFLGGSLVVGAAWAGVGLSPITKTATTDAAGARPKAPAAAFTAAAATKANATAATRDPLTPPSLDALKANPLSNGLFYVGADESSIVPRADKWQTQGCSVYGSGGGDDLQGILTRLSEGKAPPGWPKSQNCVYLGGYGIGPARPATGIDPGSANVAVRSIAISNGTDTVIWQIVDMVGFFAKYRSDLCTPGCGMLDIRKTVAEGLGLSTNNIAVGATHTHGGADGYGAWGGLPDWYRAQIRDTLIASAYNAVAKVQVATIRTGQTDARAYNNERRDTYYSAPDYGLVWLQARPVLPDNDDNGHDRDAIATLVNFAGHPTDLGSQPLMHADWPGAVDKALTEQLGGVGLLFEGGLGNVSPGRIRNASSDLNGNGNSGDDYDNVLQHGRDFASFVEADIERGGHRLPTSDVQAVGADVSHPITNVGENGLAFAGLLDRDFNPAPGSEAAAGPGAYAGGKSAPARPCASAGAFQVKTSMSGYRIGDLRVITTPGEVFGTITEVLKSKTGRGQAQAGGQVMVFGQTQDSLGYIIQSFEVDPAGGVTDNTPAPVEYEEEFMLDRCFGDHVLEAGLALGSQLN